MLISSLTYRPFKADIDISSIHYSVKEKNGKLKVILDNISRLFEHGNLHAITGPSGCGKSSLLNVLAGFNGIAKGNISLNDCRSDCKGWKDIITPVRSYILQDDFLISELTVEEQLTYAVEFKVPNNVTENERSQIVITLLEEIGLKQCKNVKIGLLSGGERKRLSVASELVNYPPVLFLDEPTSGLDSTSCYKLVDTLKTFTRSGCNVIATIHQPNSRVFAVFDTLTVLNENGRIAYVGPAGVLAEAMHNCINVKLPSIAFNPADILFEKDNIKRLAECDPLIRTKAIGNILKRKGLNKNAMLSRMEGDDRVSLPTKRDVPSVSKDPSMMTAENIKEACIKQLPSSVHRFRTLMKRSVIQARRDYVFTAGRMIAYFLVALLVGVMFQFVAKNGGMVHSNVAFLFFMVMMSSMAIGIVTIMHSHHFLDAFLREHINSWYGISHFYLTRAIIELISNAISGTAFPYFMWLMTAQTRIWWPTILILPLIVTLHATAMHHLCLLPAMFAERAALPQLPFGVAMLQTVFGGFFILFRELPVWLFWGRYLVVGSFSFMAVMKLAYKKIDNNQIIIPCENEHPICMAFKTGEDVLTAYGVDPYQSYWPEILEILGHAVGWFFIGWMLVGVYLRKERNAIARL